MTYGIGTPDVFIPFDRGRLFRKFFALTVPGAAALTVSGFVGLWILYERPAAGPVIDQAPPAVAPVLRPTMGHFARAVLAPVLTPLRRARHHTMLAANPFGALLNPSFSLGFKPLPLAQSAPLAAQFGALPTALPATMVAVEPPKAPEAAVAKADQSVPLPVLRPETKMADLQSVPLPTPRPRELGWPVSHGQLRATAHAMAEEEQNKEAKNETVVPQSTSSDHRNFFQKFFGVRPASQPGLAYASAEDGMFSNSERRLAAGATPPYDRWTAVYNIASHTVYLPDGTRLEAHSGMGNWIDDPHHVNQRMRGATPPDVYDLKPREALFHGVQALRLIPVGSGNLYGRTGLLAHTYMLGPSGQSFGCVSFKNYRKFLEAYENGEIKRLVVVAGL